MENIKVPGICNFRKCTLSDDELLQAVSNHMEKLYQVGSIPCRHIPARPNEDFDLLVGELMIRLSETVEAVGLLQAVLADNYNLENSHEIDPELRNAIQNFLDNR